MITGYVRAWWSSSGRFGGVAKSRHPEQNRATPKHLEFRGHEGFSVSLSGDDDATLRSYWEQLAEGGRVVEPLETAPWGDSFGMLVDRFGVSWLVNIAGEGS